MLTRGYFSLNWKRTRKDFLVVLVGAFLLEIGLFLQSLTPYSPGLMFAILVAVGTVIRPSLNRTKVSNSGSALSAARHSTPLRGVQAGLVVVSVEIVPL
jgi:hypothetical protein